MISTVHSSVHVTSEPVSAQIRRLVDQAADLWWECDSTLPDLGAEVSPAQQRDNERRISSLLDHLTAEIRAMPPLPAARMAARERILREGFAVAQALFGFEEHSMEVIRRGRFIDITEWFARMARQYDPAISGEDIYQASRNVMTMNFLQLLFGLPVQMTPAVFAYSMLYPYTDNYLDNPAISMETKAGFNRRFWQRLAGQAAEPANPHEERIWDLVTRVEEQYPRYHFAQVYESLLGIHEAQSRSLRQLRRSVSPYEVDVLRISLEKGGTSVLADGYLVAGSLSEEQAAFAFNYGAFTQLMDDMEDIEADRAAGFNTIFSQTAGHWPLDALTNRTLHLGARVFGRMDTFPVDDARPLQELILRGLNPLLAVSAAGAARYYSPQYIRTLEAHMPIRFRFLSDKRKQLERNRVSLMKFIE